MLVSFRKRGIPNGALSPVLLVFEFMGVSVAGLGWRSMEFGRERATLEIEAEVLIISLDDVTRQDMERRNKAESRQCSEGNEHLMRHLLRTAQGTQPRTW